MIRHRSRPEPLGLKDQTRRLFWRLCGAHRRHGVPTWLARLDVSRHNVTLPGLTDAHRGLKVAQLSDFHIGPPFNRAAVEYVVDRCNGERPDLVLLTGDFIQKADEAETREAIAALARLRSPLGLYGSLGNHDHWEDTELIKASVADAGIVLLNNAVAEVKPGLWLAGLDDLMGGEPDMDGVLHALPDQAAVILMSHSPGMWFEAHAHQAPSESISTYRYPAGWYRSGRSQMYVSRGVGFFQTMPLRLNCPAELPVFTLA